VCRHGFPPRPRGGGVTEVVLGQVVAVAGAERAPGNAPRRLPVDNLKQLEEALMGGERTRYTSYGWIFYVCMYAILASYSRS